MVIFGTEVPQQTLKLVFAGLRLVHAYGTAIRMKRIAFGQIEYSANANISGRAVALAMAKRWAMPLEQNTRSSLLCFAGISIGYSIGPTDREVVGTHHISALAHRATGFITLVRSLTPDRTIT